MGDELAHLEQQFAMPPMAEKAAFMDEVQVGDWIRFPAATVFGVANRPDPQTKPKRVTRIRNERVGGEDYVLGILLNAEGQEEHFSGHIYGSVFISRPVAYASVDPDGGRRGD